MDSLYKLINVRIVYNSNRFNACVFLCVIVFFVFICKCLCVIMCLSVCVFLCVFVCVIVCVRLRACVYVFVRICAYFCVFIRRCVYLCVKCVFLKSILEPLLSATVFTLSFALGMFETVMLPTLGTSEIYDDKQLLHIGTL